MTNGLFYNPPGGLGYTPHATRRATLEATPHTQGATAKGTTMGHAFEHEGEPGSVRFDQIDIDDAMSYGGVIEEDRTPLAVQHLRHLVEAFEGLDDPDMRITSGDNRYGRTLRMAADRDAHNGLSLEDLRDILRMLDH